MTSSLSKLKIWLINISIFLILRNSRAISKIKKSRLLLLYFIIKIPHSILNLQIWMKNKFKISFFINLILIKFPFWKWARFLMIYNQKTRKNSTVISITAMSNLLNKAKSLIIMTPIKIKISKLSKMTLTWQRKLLNSIFKVRKN